MRRYLFSALMIVLLLSGCGAPAEPVTPLLPAEPPPVSVMPEVPAEVAPIPLPEPEPTPVPEPAPEEFVAVTDYIPGIYTELRYASDNNFTHQVIYSFSDAYLAVRHRAEAGSRPEITGNSRIFSADLGRLPSRFRPVQGFGRSAPIPPMWQTRRRAIPPTTGAIPWTSRWSLWMANPWKCPRILTTSPPWRTGITATSARKPPPMPGCWRRPDRPQVQALFRRVVHYSDTASYPWW